MVWQKELQKVSEWMEMEFLFLRKKRKKLWECGRVDLRKCLEKHRSSENFGIHYREVLVHVLP